MISRRRKMTDNVYMDNAATTPMREEVVGAYAEFALSSFGNPSSFQHSNGQKAKSILDWCRDTHAGYMKITTPPDESIIFTANATESNNIIIRNVYERMRATTGRTVIITSNIEHSSVKNTASNVAGPHHILVPVDSSGYVIESEYERILDRFKSRIALVSIILVHSETGTVQRISRLAKIAKMVLGQDIPFHTDATQAFGKYEIYPEKLGIDLLSASAHKYHGPLGVGIIYTKPGILHPEYSTMTGGGQEFGIRAGTQNVPAIAAATVALKYMHENRDDIVKRVSEMKEYIISGIVSRIAGTRINGAAEGAYNIVSIGIPNVSAANLVEYLNSKGISIGTGSACNKGKPSESLLSMGRTPKEISETVRISLSDMNTMEECKKLVSDVLGYWTVSSFK